MSVTCCGIDQIVHSTRILLWSFSIIFSLTCLKIYQGPVCDLCWAPLLLNKGNGLSEIQKRERDSGSGSMNVFGIRMCCSLREIKITEVIKYEGIMPWVKTPVLSFMTLACSWVILLFIFILDTLFYSIFLKQNKKLNCLGGSWMYCPYWSAVLYCQPLPLHKNLTAVCTSFLASQYWIFPPQYVTVKYSRLHIFVQYFFIYFHFYCVKVDPKILYVNISIGVPLGVRSGTNVFIFILLYWKTCSVIIFLKTKWKTI